MASIILTKLEESPLLRLLLQLGAILFFAGGVWVSYARDTADFREKDRSHDEQIMKLTGLVEALTITVGEMAANSSSEIRLQEYRNDAFHERDSDYESRLRRLEKPN